MRRRDSLRALASIAFGGAAARTGVAATRTHSSIQPRTIQTRDGIELFHREWGDGRPIVFVHAWAMSADFWEYQMNDLCRRGFRCVGFDRRGSGRSGDTGRGYDVDTLADDLAAVLEQLDLRDVTLVGHSMGGAEAVRYLSRHRNRRVARLILVAPMVPYLAKAPDNPLGVDARQIDALCDRLATNRAEWLHENARPFFMPDTPESTLRWAEAMMLKTSLKATIDTLRAVMTTDFRADLRALRLPTLVIHGTADQSIPWQFGRETASLVSGARFLPYDGAPHGVLITHASRLSADIAQFARST